MALAKNGAVIGLRVNNPVGSVPKGSGSCLVNQIPVQTVLGHCAPNSLAMSKVSKRPVWLGVCLSKRAKRLTPLLEVSALL